MITLLILVIMALLLAGVPAALLTVNLSLFRAPEPGTSHGHAPELSVLIPARNEANHIRTAMQSVLANQDVTLELIILNDQSTDATEDIVQTLAVKDSRITLINSSALPENWCGKQHACWQLAQHAHYDLMVFMDADVELAPQALARMAGFMQTRETALASGFPLQKTGSLFEKLLIPLMYFILLGFLPLNRMRKSNSPAYSAGCGQLFIARKSAYMAVGGHSAIRASRHDGITLPRAFRQAGFATDIFDATALASCRMYHTAGEVFHGLAKNATEALASRKMIVPATIILLGGQVVPLILLITAVLLRAAPVIIAGAALATGLVYLPRMLLTIRFRQSTLGAILHPLGICLLVVIQWYAWLRQLLGKNITWRGRA